MSRHTIIDAGDREQRLRTIQTKLNDKHAEALGRALGAEMADDGARQAAVKQLLGLRSLYAPFGLTPPQLSPDLKAEVESLSV
jgi:hypothetical protein